MSDLHTRLVAALQARLEVARAELTKHVGWSPYHHPDREIRRVEALLRVVERHANPHGCVGPDGTDWVFRREAACPTLADLAAGEGITDD